MLLIWRGNVDTCYVCTYYVYVNITLSIDEQVAERARERLRASGKTLNQEIREHLLHIAGDDDVERDIEAYLKRVGQGISSRWKWNRDELYEERLRWPRK